MSATPSGDEHPARARAIFVVAGSVLVVEAIVLGIVVAAQPAHQLLPVTAGFAGRAGRVTLSRIDVEVGAVVLCAMQALARLAVGGWLGRGSSTQGNCRAVRWIELLVTTPVTVFLIAQLNGIADLGALVLIYAIASGTVLGALVQERSTGTSRLPLAVSAMVGIVPWGVIAFQEIGAGVAGGVVAPGIRLVTVLMLAAALVLFVSEWRRQRRPRGDVFRVAVALVATSLFGWLVVLGVA